MSAFRNRLLRLLILLAAIGLVAGCSASAPAGQQEGSEGASAESSALPDAAEEEALLPVFPVTALPDAAWQRADVFPHPAGYPDASLAQNSMRSFTFEEGQGALYLRLHQEVQALRVCINGVPAKSEAFAGGGTFAVDFSSCAKSGMNTLQVSGITPSDLSEAVSVFIPYPAVRAAKPEEAGISEEALQLIEDIIVSDIAHGFPAAQLAVIRSGMLVYEKGFGTSLRYREDGTEIRDAAPVTAQTLFDLASVTKMFAVNYPLQKLVTDGALSLDTPLVQLFGAEFAETTEQYPSNAADAETMQGWKEEITVRDLLTHRAGFPESPASYGSFLELSLGTHTRSEIRRALFAIPLLHEPRTETRYSDIDYMLLGLLIEELTGKSLGTYLRETFTEPMGLKHITFNPLENGFAKEEIAATELAGNTREGHIGVPGYRSHTLQGEVHDENAWHAMDGVSGHAGLFANATDLALLSTLMLTGGYGENRFFSRDVLDAFTAPLSETEAEWGLGWWRRGSGKRDWFFGTQSASSSFGHQGWTGTMVFIDPESRLVIGYLTNKIHSPLTDASESLTRFDGNWFTASTLSFVPQILSAGMEDQTNIGERLTDFLYDMTLDSFLLVPEGTDKSSAHPAVRNVQSKLALFDARAEASGQEALLARARALREAWEEYQTGAEDAFRIEQTVVNGDARFAEYLPLLENKRVALFTNHTGVVYENGEGTHILDALLQRGVDVAQVFVPEHGFRGDADAGAAIEDSVDAATGVPVISLYGAGVMLTPEAEDMRSFDTLVIDIRDVGVRFYTYYLTMYDLLSACAEAGKEVVLLDAPNPNGFYVDGPLLEEDCISNVGRLPLPMVHGLTLGEMARMMAGEGWIEDELKLRVIPCLHYTHQTKAVLSAAPSPNLRDMRAVYLYSSTALFENTLVSVGRGTDEPFVCFGSPYFAGEEAYGYSFVPRSVPGAASPPFQDEACYGVLLKGLSAEQLTEGRINWDYLCEAYHTMKRLKPELDFFGTPDAEGRYWIDCLTGTRRVRTMLEEGKTAQEIADSCREGVLAFRERRRPYLLYDE